jgi:alpha-N-arabinofuranosidase
LSTSALLGATVGCRSPRVVIDPGRQLGRVSRYVFGGFVEHLGRCINGGLFDEGSPLSDGRGFRRDVLALLKPLRVPVLRWPGGNFASNYHWKDGVGPRSERPARVELAWGGVEPNHFGTDEFLAYCAELGAAPYICLNMGTGTLSDALDWVEYCNSTARGHWAERRQRNGHEEPYRVVYWGLGNEMYGDWQVGQLSAPEYVALAKRWAKAIRRADPAVKLVSCGLSGWSDWDRQVVDGLAGLADLHSLHIYTGSPDYWANVLTPHQAERAIRYTSAMLSQAAYNRRLLAPARIAYDEWNVWYRTSDGTLEERYDWADALAVATYLNIFVRNCEWVAMANLAQLVNAIAPVVTSPTTAATQPIYYPFLLHSEAALEMAADVAVSGPLVDAPSGSADRWEHRVGDLGPFCVLDAAATLDPATRAVAVTVVNRADADLTTELRLRDAKWDGRVRARVLTAGEPQGGELGLHQVKMEEGSEDAKAESWQVNLPARSFSVFQAVVEPG